MGTFAHQVKHAPVQGTPFKIMLAELASPSNEGKRAVNQLYLTADYFGVDEIHDGDVLNWRFTKTGPYTAEAIPLLTCPHG